MAERAGSERHRLFEDTPPEIEGRLVAGYRAMTPAERLERVASLNRAIEGLAAARIRVRYGPSLTERELRLRLGALRIPREDMMRVFDWDPLERGY